MEKSSTDDQRMTLEVLHPNAAGIDIGNAAHYVDPVLVNTAFRTKQCDFHFAAN
jgi:hypothetical protein